MTYLDGGVESGFNHVEPSVDKPHLYQVKGTQKGMSLTQVPLEKGSLNTGDSFILFANPSTVWLWNGESANPDEKAKAISLAEKMCTQGTVVALDQGEDGDAAEFWAYLGDGEIQDADEGDEDVETFCPLLFKLCEDPEEEPEQVAKAEAVKVRFGPPQTKLSRDLLDESNVSVVVELSIACTDSLLTFRSIRSTCWMPVGRSLSGLERMLIVRRS